MSCHSFSRQKTLATDNLKFCIALPVVQTKKWSGGQCTVMWMPNFRRWVGYHIFLPMVLRCACFVPESSPKIALGVFTLGGIECSRTKQAVCIRKIWLWIMFMQHNKWKGFACQSRENIESQLSFEIAWYLWLEDFVTEE